MADLLDDLNPAQRDAVTAIDGPLLVLAGAGTGKTRVITVRIAHMLRNGIDPRSVLAVTFTNKAAAEMRERIAALVGKQRAKLLTVGTFHSFCVRLLREYGSAIGVHEGFTICDTADQTSLLKGALRELHIPEAAIQPSALQSAISLAKNRLQTPEGFLEQAMGDRDELVGRAWRRYEDSLERARLLDFDDLLLRALALLRTDDALASLRARYTRVLVDEFQDTNAPQYEIVHALCDEHRNLCAVGDDDQSIYGWRGADVKKILGFETHFPEAKIVRLETNYRSTSNILSAANRVIGNNPNRHDKVLRAHAGEGEPVRVARMDDEVAEADGIVIEILEQVRRRQAVFSDFAILFRTAVQPRAFEGQLRARGVPYRLVGGMSFFDRKEIRDALSYLRLVANPLDEASFLRVVNRPPRGVGKTSLERAMEYATAHAISVPKAFDHPEAIAEEVGKVPPAAVEAVQGLRRLLATLGREEPGENLVLWIKDLLEAVGYRGEVDRSYADAKTREDRWRTVMQILDFAENYVRRAKEPSLGGFLEELSLTTQDDRRDEKEDRRDQVTLMTLHAAKGLEFPVVYLVGVEEGLLPHARAVAEDGVEEERRLMYVGITRARKRLTVTWSGERSKYGTRSASMPSRFLFEAKGELPPEGWLGAEQLQAMAEADRAAGKRGGGRAKKKKRTKAAGGRRRSRRP